MAAFYNDTDLFSGEFWHPPVFTSQPTAPNSGFLPTNTDPSTWQPEASHSIMIYLKVRSGTPYPNHRASNCSCSPLTLTPKSKLILYPSVTPALSNQSPFGNYSLPSNGLLKLAPHDDSNVDWADCDNICAAFSFENNIFNLKYRN